MEIQTFNNLLSLLIFGLLQLFSTSSFPTNSAQQPPTLLWTQQFGEWSKFKGIAGQPRDWMNKTTKYANSEPMEKTNYISLDHNRRTDTIYWTDQLNPGAIFRQKTADSLSWVRSGVNFHQIDSTEIDHFVVDWATDNIYFIHSTNKTIAVVAKVMGQTALKILHFDLEEPASIACDSEKGLLFWTDSSMNSPRIESSILNGEGRKVILSKPFVARPTALTTLKDGNSQQLIWVDEGLKRIMSCQYDGSSAKVLFAFDSGQLFKGITAFEEYIFLTDEYTLSIDIITLQNNRLPVQQIVVDAHPNDILIIQSVDPNFRHECDSKLCQYFCLNVGNSKGECGCPVGYYLALDGLSCTASEAKFIFSTPDKLVMAVPDSNRLLSAPTSILNVSLFSLTNISMNASFVESHFATRTVFWADKPAGSIYSIRDLSKNPADTNFGDVQEITVQQTSIEGVAVHWLDSLLLWIDSSLNHIMGSKFDGSYHSIYINNLSQPKTLAINPHDGTIFWSQKASSGNGRDICFTRFQGNRSIQCLVRVDRGDVDDLVFDVRSNRLYWSNPSTNQVSYLRIGSSVMTYNFNTSYTQKFTVIQNVITVMHPVLLSPAEQPLLFYAQSNQSYLNKRTGVIFLSGSKSFQTLIPNQSQSQIGDVVLYGDYLQPNKTTGCFRNNPCQQICISSNADPTCKCAIGYKEDGSKCNSRVLTGPSVFFVDPYMKQIYQISSQSSSPSSQTLSPTSPQSSAVQPVYEGIVDLDSTFALPHPPVSRPTQFVVDSARGLVHIFDQGRVKTYNPSNQHMETIYSIDENEGCQIVQMAFDKNENVIYLSDISKGRILKLDVTTKTANLWKENLVCPFAIAVDLLKKVLYWSEGGILNCAPLSAPGNVTALVTLKNITSITVREEEGLVFMSDIEEGSIYMLNVSKVVATSIYQSKGLKTFKVIVDDSNIYFVAWNRRAVYRLQRKLNNTAEQVEMLSVPIFSRITDIAYVPFFIIQPETTSKIPLIVGLTLGLLALLLLLLLLLLLCRFCRKRNKSQKNSGFQGSANTSCEDFSNADKDSLVGPNREKLFYLSNQLSMLPQDRENQYNQSMDDESLSANTQFKLADGERSSTCITPKTSNDSNFPSAAYLHTDNAPNSPSTGELDADNAPNSPSAAYLHADNADNADNAPNFSSTADLHADNAENAPNFSSAADLHEDNSRNLLLANRGKPKVSRSSRNEPVGSFSDVAISACGADLPDSTLDLRASPSTGPLDNKSPPPACKSPGLPFSSSNPCLPSSDITHLNPNAAPPLVAIGPERGKYNPTKVFYYVPQKLHKQPRGFAPASHCTPAPVKNTLGRLRKTERPQLQIGEQNGAQDC